MDQLVLRRLMGELDERLRGARIDQVYAIPKDHVAFVVGRRSAPRLWFCTEPAQPHLYERGGAHPTPKTPPAFAMAARKLLSGRRIEALEAAGSDRIVTLHCSGDAAAHVVFEVIPRRATAMIVDADGVIRAVWHPRRGRPGIGQRYEPPPADRRRDLGRLGNSDWQEMQAAPDEEGLARTLLREVAGMSLLLAREIVARHRSGTPLRSAAEQEIERADAEPTAARVYSPAPLEMLESLPGPRSFLLAPYPLRHADAQVDADRLHVTSFANLREAAARFYPLRAELVAIDQARRDLVAGLDIAAARTRRTLDAVSKDADSAGEAHLHRQLGDLLLAHPDAPRHGDNLTVPDDYAGGAPRQVRIDPSLSVVDNAQRYYRKARRAERSQAQTLERRRRLGDRLASLERLVASAAAADDLARCGKLARQAEKLGAKTRRKRWSAPEATLSEPRRGAPSRPHPVAPDADLAAAHPENRAVADVDTPTAQGRSVGPGIRAFTSSDGSEILVGRNAEANERLTHKLAAPHDFWLHAEGPGSHVVIRNPTRSDEPSDEALAAAASLAAHFSFARGATKVNVRWTQARHLRKPRRGPKGQVILRQAHTVLAEPIGPQELFPPADDRQGA